MKRISFRALQIVRHVTLAAVLLTVLLGGARLIVRVSDPRQAMPDAAPGTAPAPPFGFKAENWFAYLRKHRDVPSEFFNVPSDEHGLVWIRCDAVERLRQMTGSLPEEFFYGKFDEDGVYRVFDFSQDKYVRNER